MRVYIASKYIVHKDINNFIYQELKKNAIDAFLPESINNDALDKENMRFVSEKCFEEIERCDVILAVCPFGKSVSSELGYAIALKRRLQSHKYIVALHLDFGNEAMLSPYIDDEVENVPELIQSLKNIEKLLLQGRR